MENKNQVFKIVDRAAIEENFNKIKEENEFTIPNFKKRDEIKTVNSDAMEILKNHFKKLKEK